MVFRHGVLLLHVWGKKLFMNLDEKVNNVTKFGNDRKISVKGKGKILIRDVTEIIL